MIQMLTRPARRWLQILAATACCCALTLLTTSAVAGDPAAAESLFQEGRELMEAKDYDKACAKFAASMQAEPSGGTALNLAKCYELRGRSASAWVNFERAAGLFRKSGDPKREAFARDKAAELAPKLSRLTIESEEPDGLTIARNGEPVPSGIVGTSVPVDPGKHEITATAPGRQAWSGTVFVGTDGSEETVQIPVLLPLSDGASSGDAPDPAADDGGVDPLLVTGGVLLGVGGAAILGGSILGGIVLGEAADAKDLCPDNQCGQPGLDAKEDAEGKALGADLLIGLGSAVAATGIVLVIISAVDDSDAHTEPAARLLPLVGPSQAGLGAVISF